ncbi:TPA: hypothetical protein ACK2XP_005669, partial [Klebsiella oxytoca]
YFTHVYFFPVCTGLHILTARLLNKKVMMRIMVHGTDIMVDIDPPRSSRPKIKVTFWHKRLQPCCPSSCDFNFDQLTGQKSYEILFSSPCAT